MGVADVSDDRDMYCSGLVNSSMALLSERGKAVEVASQYLSR
jgi:hypothetical protein